MAGLLEQVPEAIADKVKLIDLADPRGAPGINLLDARIFADRDRTADSVVAGGPRPVGPVGSPDAVHPGAHREEPPRGQPPPGHQRRRAVHPPGRAALLADDNYRTGVLTRVSDHYLLDWWGGVFASWRRDYQGDALAPVQTRLSYYASSEKARAILGQPRSTIDLRQTIREGGVLLVSTAQGAVGRDVAALVGASLLNLVDAVIREQGSLPPQERRGRAGGGGRDAVHARRGLRKHVVGAGQVRRQFHSRHPEPGQAERPLADHARHHPGQRGLPGRVPGGGHPTPGSWCGSWARTTFPRTTWFPWTCTTATSAPPWAPSGCRPSP